MSKYFGWLADYLPQASDNQEKIQDVGLVNELLEGEPGYVSPEIRSLEPDYELPERTSGDQLSLTNESVKKFDHRSREYRVVQEQGGIVSSPFVQLVLPDPETVEQSFEDLEDSETPVYLRTVFFDSGERETVENVYKFDTDTLQYELVNLKYNTPRSTLGETGMQQVVSGNDIIAELEDSYDEAVEQEYSRN